MLDRCGVPLLQGHRRPIRLTRGWPLLFDPSPYFNRKKVLGVIKRCTEAKKWSLFRLVLSCRSSVHMYIYFMWSGCIRGIYLYMHLQCETPNIQYAFSFFVQLHQHRTCLRQHVPTWYAYRSIVGRAEQENSRQGIYTPSVVRS